MQRIQLKLKRVVASRGEMTGLLCSPGDCVIIQRGQPRWLILMCPCGCGEELPVNLDKRAGKAWRLYMNRESEISVYPSVWRDTGCESHYIILRNVIHLFAKHGDDWEPRDHLAASSVLLEAVYKEIPQTGFISYVDIADRLGEIPWDILDVCRRLVRDGRIREGTGNQAGQFGISNTTIGGTGRSWWI